MPPRRFLLRLGASAVCASVVLLASCREDSSGPDRISSVAFVRQPSGAIAGEAIEPPVEVMLRSALGRPLMGTVTVSLDPNPCSWQLSGTLTAEVSDTTAVFGDLALDKVGRGYALRASADGVSALSAPFDVSSGVVGAPVILENVLCTKPNPQGDGESLTYVPEDDNFWIADDNNNAIYEVDRRTGTYRSQITLETILDVLPDAGQCDDEDDDPNTHCSYVNEIELLAYDPDGRSLYLVNTVNTPGIDRPAIFRLRKEACTGCFAPESWQPLPTEPSYWSIFAVEGELYLAIGKCIYAYDYDTNRLATVDADGDSLPPAYETSSSILALSFDGTFMWILTHSRLLYQVSWATRTERRSYELDGFGFSLPRGMEVVNDTIYVLEGDVPNPIYVLSQRQP
ncbi:MAG: hypothetical protein PVI01_07635 [Gemmatimonadales bacterium]